MVGSLVSKSHKNPLTQYSNHVIDCSVQCMRWELEIVKLMLVAMVFAAVSELINGAVYRIQGADEHSDEDM